MTVLEQVGLPDAPAAPPAPGGEPAAPVSSPTPRLDFARPASRRAGAALALPPLLTAVAATLYLGKEYKTGADFVNEANYPFAWMVHTGIFAGIAVALLTAALVALGVLWRRLGTQSRALAVACVLATVAAAGAAISFSGAAFHRGKRDAYAGVNATVLVSDCVTMAALPPPAGCPPGVINLIEGNDPSLPAYVRSLGPKYVSVRAGEVEIVMSHDFMSGTRHESFLVPLAPLDTDPGRHAADRRWIVVSTQPPVFRLPWAE